MSDSTPTLEPCPFCGGPGHLTRFDQSPRGRGWHVVCHGEKLCPLYCNEPYSDLLTREEAVTRWNTRASGNDELEPARPLIEAIAAWEREHGTVAAIMPDEYADFCQRISRAAIRGSARAASPAHRSSQMGDVGRFDPSRDCSILTDTGGICPRHGYSHHEDTAMTDPKTVTVQERPDADTLARQLRTFDGKVQNIADNKQLTPAGQASALALLVALNGSLFRRAADALTQLNGGRNGR